MTVASIDIGTNTVLLLISEVDIQSKKISTILNEYRMPRIGKALKPGNPISDEKITALFSVLDEYWKIIKEHKCEEVIISATNAFRIASNAMQIIKKINKKYNADVNIISGEEEAEYAFLGAISSFNSLQSALVIDIGGGSTEIIYGKKNKIKFRKSFQIGSVSGTEKYLLHSPPLQNEILNLKEKINTTFSELRNNFSPGIAIAIAGTPTTLVCMLKNLKDFDEAEVEKSSVSIGQLDELITALCKMNASEIKNRYGNVMRGREDIILAGAFILYGTMHILNLKEVKVSSRGIRYGAVFKYLNQL